MNKEGERRGEREGGWNRSGEKARKKRMGKQERREDERTV